MWNSVALCPLTITSEARPVLNAREPMSHKAWIILRGELEGGKSMFISP
jgi:hypothetical protein